MENSSIRRKFRGSFSVCLAFPEKMVWCSSSKFYIFEPFTNVQSHIRFDLGFWQTSEQVYRKLQYEEKKFSKFQSLLRCLKKMVLYSLRKSHISELCANIQSLRRFDLGFLKIPKHVYR